MTTSVAINKTIRGEAELSINRIRGSVVIGSSRRNIFSNLSGIDWSAPTCAAAFPLPRLAERLKRKAMKRVFDMDDRARLRERFYGAIHTVLARL